MGSATSYFARNEEYRVLFIGLDCAGKTCMLLLRHGGKLGHATELLAMICSTVVSPQAGRDCHHDSNHWVQR
jgi:hypothetical protein